MHTLRVLLLCSSINRPNFYVHCPARTDPTAAPQGCESLMVLLPVANLQEVQRQQVGLGVTTKPLCMSFKGGGQS